LQVWRSHNHYQLRKELGSMDRRQFAGTLAAALASAITFGWAQTTPRVRRNISELSQTQVNVLAKAVMRMKSKPASDPTSWDALAALHSLITFFTSRKLALDFASDPGTDPGTAEFVRQAVDWIDFDKLGAAPQASRDNWNKCLHHGSQAGAFVRKGHFLSWHRQFLLVFEQALVSAMDAEAKLLGVTGESALPYWDYFSEPALPVAFRRPTLEDGSPNALYVSFRDPDMNHLTQPAQVGPFDLRAFAMRDFQTEPWEIRPNRIVNGFDEGLESEPHDTLHGQIGGLMGAVVTSSWDPIFWLHHANIDRLWSAWMKVLPAPPSDLTATWRDQRFEYPTVNGVVRIKAGDLLDTTALGYVYSSLDLPPATVAAQTTSPLPAILAAESPVGGIGTLASTASKPVRFALPRSGGGLKLAIRSKQFSSALGAVAQGTSSPEMIRSASLVLQGLRLTPEGYKYGFVFDVFLQDPKTKRLILIGRLNRFTLSCLDGNRCDPSGGENVTLSMSEALQALDSSAKLDPASLDVYFVPVRRSGSSVVDQAQTLMTVDSARIETSTLPTK
jgi:hypothetical protein